MQLIGRLPQEAPFFLEVRSDDQKNDDGEGSRNAGGGRQSLLAMTPGPIDTGGAALRDQRGVVFGRRRISASHRSPRSLGIGFEREHLGADLSVIGYT